MFPASKGKVILAGLIFLLTSVLVAQKPMMEKGDYFLTYIYKDQWDKDQALKIDVQYAIFSGDRGSGKMGREAIAALGGKKYMDSHMAVFIADISGAPSLIRSLFIIPSLQELDFPVFLILSGSQTDDVPMKEDSLTVFKLDKGVIQSIDYAKDQSELDALLK